MSLPKLFDVIVAVLGDDHGSLGRVVPDKNTQFLSVVLQNFEIGLRQKLVVQDALIENEAITF